MIAQSYQETSQKACQGVLRIRRSEESQIWWPLGARRRGDCSMWGAPEKSQPEAGPSKPMLVARSAEKVQLLSAILMTHCIALHGYRALHSRAGVSVTLSSMLSVVLVKAPPRDRPILYVQC